MIEIAFNPVTLIMSFMVFCVYVYQLTVFHRIEEERR